jgi:hypothetical protein
MASRFTRVFNVSRWSSALSHLSRNLSYISRDLSCPGIYRISRGICRQHPISHLFWSTHALELHTLLQTTSGLSLMSCTHTYPPPEPHTHNACCALVAAVEKKKSVWCTLCGGRTLQGSSAKQLCSLKSSARMHSSEHATTRFMTCADENNRYISGAQHPLWTSLDR